MDQEIVLTSPETFEGKLKLTWCIEDAQKDTTIKFKIMKLAIKAAGPIPV